MRVSDHGGLLRTRDEGEKQVTNALELFFDLVNPPKETPFRAPRGTIGWPGRTAETRWTGGRGKISSWVEEVATRSR